MNIVRYPLGYHTSCPGGGLIDSSHQAEETRFVCLCINNERKYWPDFIKGNEINKQSEGKEICKTDSLSGIMDSIPFHAFGLKEPDYMMRVLASYGTNERNKNHRSRQV